VFYEVILFRTLTEYSVCVIHAHTFQKTE